MNDKQTKQPEKFQNFFVLQLLILLTLQFALMERLFRVTRAKIEAFDAIVYVSYWFLMGVTVATAAAGICSFISFAGWRRTSSACAISLASFIIILPLSDAACYLTFGVHLSHPTILSAFSLTNLNFGIQISATEVAVILVVLFTVFFCQWALLRFINKIWKPLPWRRIIPRVAYMVGGSFAIVLAFTKYFGPTAFPHAAIWGYDELFLNKNDIGLTPIPKYDVEGLENARLTIRPNILKIQIESLRWDMVNQETAPTLYELSKSSDCSRSDQHYAGSNLTAKGAFSLLNGMNAYRYYSFGESKVSSLPLAILRKNDYRIFALDASGMMSYPILPLDTDQFDLYEQFIDGRSDVTDEKKITERLREMRKSIASDSSNYIFVFLYATHDPYMYPKNFTEVFSPSLAPSDEYLSLNIPTSEVHQRIKNRYLNSVRYVDSVVGDILSIYSEDIRTGKLIVAVTGDHGEEFWEFGARGHVGGKFQDVRSRVPFIMCYAGKGGSVWPLSSHADIFPTMFSWMGLEETSSSALDMLDGISLDKPLHAKEFVIVSDASFPRDTPEFAIVAPEKKYLFKLKSSEPQDAELVGVLVNDIEQELTEENRTKALMFLKKFHSNWYRFFKPEFGTDVKEPGTK